MRRKPDYAKIASMEIELGLVPAADVAECMRPQTKPKKPIPKSSLGLLLHLESTMLPGLVCVLALMAWAVIVGGAVWLVAAASGGG